MGTGGRSRKDGIKIMTGGKRENKKERKEEKKRGLQRRERKGRRKRKGREKLLKGTGRKKE